MLSVTTPPTVTSAVTTLLRSGILACFTSILFLFASTCSLAANDTPTNAVQTTVDEILVILRKPDFNLDNERTNLRTEILRAFDDVAMAQSVLSTNWKDASPDQREEFTALLLDTIESTYIGRIQAYTDEKVEYRDEEIKGTRATVNTVIVADSNDIPITYKLRKRSDGWFVYDVEVENVSMVSTYRENYRSVVKKSGMDGLLEQMRAKIAELKSGVSA